MSCGRRSSTRTAITTWASAPTGPREKQAISAVRSCSSSPRTTTSPRSDARCVWPSAPQMPSSSAAVGDHYGVYEGGEDFDRVVNVEIQFLHRHTAVPAPSADQ